MARAPHTFGNRLLAVSKSPAFRALALEVLAAGLAAVDPYEAVRRSLERTGSLLRVGDSVIDLDRVGRIIVVGAGKAGGPMAAAVEDILDERIAAGWVNVKTGHLTPTRTIHLHEAGHPIPDEAGAHGSEQIAHLLQGLGSDDLVLCLSQAVDSALLGLPYPDIRLEEIRQLTESLLRAGASINELNTVRKHLDRLKGGGVARLACTRAACRAGALRCDRRPIGCHCLWPGGAGSHNVCRCLESHRSIRAPQQAARGDCQAARARSSGPGARDSRFE